MPICLDLTSSLLLLCRNSVCLQSNHNTKDMPIIWPGYAQRYGGFSPSVCFSLQKLCSSQLRGSRRRARSSFAPSRTSFNFLTLFFIQSQGNPPLLVKRQYCSGCWAVLSHEKVGKDMQEVPKICAPLTKRSSLRHHEVRRCARCGGPRTTGQFADRCPQRLGP